MLCIRFCPRIASYRLISALLSLTILSIFTILSQIRNAHIQPLNVGVGSSFDPQHIRLNAFKVLYIRFWPKDWFLQIAKHSLKPHHFVPFSPFCPKMKSFKPGIIFSKVTFSRHNIVICICKDKKKCFSTASNAPFNFVTDCVKMVKVLWFESISTFWQIFCFPTTRKDWFSIFLNN